MKTTGAMLLGCALLLGAPAALADEPAAAGAEAVPLGSPAEWLKPGDYPALALRYDMAGITGFRLAVAADGKPTQCEIALSSGFDVLDAATCERVMLNGRFVPPHDEAGKAIASSYSGRVRWVVPEDGSRPLSESLASMLLSIDPEGKTTSCRLVLHVPDHAAAPNENPCNDGANAPPPSLARELRGSLQSGLAEVEFRRAIALSPALLARAIAPVPGYEQRALNIHRFSVKSGGKVDACTYQEQRGIRDLANDFCRQAQRQTFDPPFAAFDKDGTATGWHVIRVLLKTGQ